ncbi:hypothetical protein [Stigmatella erecta]|uniref:hypothetical protein n=1 Tax=Stigmatella erecta TaxID=83460 RepID=UPI001FE35AB3|nr:hypothetical protein [Stigmatella erecta]
MRNLLETEDILLRNCGNDVVHRDAKREEGNVVDFEEAITGLDGPERFCTHWRISIFVLLKLEQDFDAVLGHRLAHRRGAFTVPDHPS